jgi:transposase InsO family protein
MTGIAGLISQGEDWKTAPIAEFYSAKLNSAQQNYAVHEIELLAGVETMLRHRNILQGAQFRWYTDHKGLIHLLKQKNLTGRQARWIEKISEFDFEIIYVPGTSNILADALSRIYSNDEAGTVRAKSEYTEHDETNFQQFGVHKISMPLQVGIEARVSLLQNNAVETAQEFAKRIKRVVLKLPNPSERQKGESSRGNTEVPTQKQELSPKLPVEPGRTLVDQSEPEMEGRNPEMEEVPSPQKIVMNAGSAHKAEQQLESIVKDFIQSMSEVQQLQEWMNPGLLSIVSQGSPGFEFPQCLKGRYSDDKFFKTIVESLKEHKNFELNDGLLFLKSAHRKLLCIPNILIEGRNAQEIIISHAHSLLAHLGTHKTIAYLRDNVWWKDLNADVQSYCETCEICKRSKPSNQKPYGLLNPLPVPMRPWEAVGIDFVGPLPVSKNRDGIYDTITVIIDLLTGMVHLVPSRQNYRAKDIAELVFEHIYKLHGLPKAIVSDRDSLFTSGFWKHLHKLMGIELKMSSAYHPQTDGATERANRTITQMLRQCVRPNQTDWVTKLPAIEFAINSARSQSTGYAPFFLNTGRMPRSMIWDSADKTEYPGVRVYAQKIKDAIMMAHDSILTARIKQTRSANRKHRPAPFAESDLVYVSTVNLKLPKGRARKLIPKYIGPYKILRDFGNNSYVIELPDELKRRGVHPVFHASLLRIHLPNDDRLFPGRLINQVTDMGESTNEWSVQEISSHRGSGPEAIFEVKWTAGDSTWLPYNKIAHLNALSNYLELLGVNDISELKNGKGQPPADDPQIYLGVMQIKKMVKEWTEGKKRQLTSSKMPTAMQALKDDIHSVITPAGNDFTGTFPGSSKGATFSHSECTSFFEISERIRKGEGPKSLSSKYKQFAVIFNQDKEMVKHHLLNLDGKPYKQLPTARIPKKGAEVRLGAATVTGTVAATITGSVDIPNSTNTAVVAGNPPAATIAPTNPAPTNPTPITPAPNAPITSAPSTTHDIANPDNNTDTNNARDPETLAQGVAHPQNATTRESSIVNSDRRVVNKSGRPVVRRDSPEPTEYTRKSKKRNYHDYNEDFVSMMEFTAEQEQAMVKMMLWQTMAEKLNATKKKYYHINERRRAREERQLEEELEEGMRSITMAKKPRYMLETVPDEDEGPVASGSGTTHDDDVEMEDDAK